MPTNLKSFPETWIPTNWTQHIGAHHSIETDSDNKYEFTCHTVVRVNDDSVNLYGQLNEHTCINTWGERRYVYITITSEGNASMKYLKGPINYSGGTSSFFV